MATNETVNQEVEQATEQAEKTFTQSELDQIIGERLKREREKYPDYDALKEKADYVTDRNVDHGIWNACVRNGWISSAELR